MRSARHILPDRQVLLRYQRRIFAYCYKNLFHRNRASLHDSITSVTSSFFSRPPAVLAVCGYTGAVFAFYFPLPYGVIASCMVLVLLFSSSRIWILDKKLLTRVSMVIVGGSIFMLMSFVCVSLRRNTAEDKLRSSTMDPPRVYDEFNGRIQSVSTADSGYQTFVIELDNGALAIFGGRDVTLPVGTRACVLGTLSQIERASNPGCFDRYDYFSRQGVFLEINTYDNCISVIEDSAGAFSLWQVLEQQGQDLRKSIGELWESVLSEEDAGLLMAMLLGDTSGLSRDLRADFRLLNLSHLTAVSGANIAFFMMPAKGAVVLVSGKRRVRGVILIAFLLFLGFLTGWSASVSRAIFVAIIHVLSDQWSKRHCPISSICAAVCLMICIQPFSALDIGFCLSVSAALSLILFSNSTADRLCLAGLPRGVAELLGPVLCAHAGMLPWLILLAGRESIFLIIVNILGSILAEGISILGLIATPFLVCASFVHVLWPAILLFAPVQGLLFLLRKLAQLCVIEGINAFRLQTVHPALLLSFAGLLFILLLRRSFLRRIAALTGCAFIAFGLFNQIGAHVDEPIATIIFADVGQGDSTLILLNDGRSVLIDCGTENAGEFVLLPMMDYFGIEKPNMSILTHLHSDHGGGYLSLVEEDRLESVYTPYVTSDSELSGLFSICEKKNVQIHSLKKGDRIVLSDDISIDVLLPSMIVESGGNADSAILFLKVAETGILFMGDAGFVQEEILSEDALLSCLLSEKTNIVKVGHHGSKYSTAADFLSLISTEAAVISVGENSYGHPSDETLERLSGADIQTYRTDVSGAILIRIFEDRYEIEKYLKW